MKKKFSGDEIGDITEIGIAKPIYGTPVVQGNPNPVMRLIFDYDRTTTSVRVIYNHCSFTDEPVMPVRATDSIWICYSKKKDDDKTYDFLLRDFKLAVNGMGILKNKFYFNSSDAHLVDEKYREFVEYVINKFR